MIANPTPPIARLLALTLLAAGCASGAQPSAVRTSVMVAPAAAPASAAQPSADPPLPALSASQIGDAGTSARRIQNLDMVKQDLATVLRGLAESFGLDHQIDPSVRGEVTMRLTDVTLPQALDAIVQPRGYQYQITGNVLRVVPTRTQTRMFTLDYVSLSRVGVASTVVQRTLGSGGAGSSLGGGAGGVASQGGGGGVGGGSGATISSVTVADLWDGIRVGLDGLVFDGPTGLPGDTLGAAASPASAAAASPTTPQASGGGAASARSAGPYTRSAGGRRLIMDPFAGIITVTAPPEKLAEVEAYISTIERSVQRQVLIEAKIVEVRLDRKFQYGIDWSVVQNLGGLNFSFGGGQAGAQFTLKDAAGSAAAINVVLHALESQGDVSVLSNPRVSVLNNQPAAFGVTTDDVFFSVTRQPLLGPTGATIGFNTQIIPQQISVGITLDVVAQISADNVITMSIRPSITEVVSEKTVQLPDGTQSTAPVIDRRDTDTMARIRGGETVVIGGLMQTRQKNTSSGIPGLRDIPVLGGLFGGVTQETEKRELVIFITPRIIAGQPQTGD